MKYITFIFLNFIVSFFADIVLNDLATLPQPFYFESTIVKSLRPYFQSKSIIIAGLYAALTVVITLLLTSFISLIFLGFANPNTLQSLILFTGLAFVIGYFIDILIERLHIFGSSLDEYYKVAGSGFWGGVAFIVSIIISYYLQAFIVPALS